LSADDSREDNFPAFVAGLLGGVFSAIVNSSILADL
jgi:hypothetical protein